MDQHGIPTLVEVKRSSDTRLRREVIGQMMDYYANALRNWPRDFFRNEYYRQGKEHGAVLFPMDLLEPNETEEAFWDKVSENFSREWIRLLFVADEIPFELKESVQVWNNGMKTTEALCVEIRRFVSSEEEFLVPRLFGSPSLHNLVARERLKGNWWDRNPNDKGALFWGLVRNEKVRQITRKLYEWIPEESLKNPDFWGGGAKQAYFVHAVPMSQGWKTVFKVYNDDYVNVVLEGIEEEEARELQGRLNRISGIKVDVIRKKGGLKESLWIKTLKLESDEIFEEFLSVMEWLGSQFSSADSCKEAATMG